MLTPLQTRMVCPDCQIIYPLDCASPRRHSIRLWQCHSLHLSGTLYAGCVRSTEWRICHGCQWSATIYNGSKLPVVYRANVRSSGCEVGHIAPSFCLHAYGPDPLGVLQIWTRHSEEESLQPMMWLIEWTSKGTKPFYRTNNKSITPMAAVNTFGIMLVSLGSCTTLSMSLSM